MENIDIFKKEFAEHKGEFVITDSWTVERFIGLAEDELDYYYVLFDGRKVRWQTCVGKLTWIKGKIDDRDYNDFIRRAKINHFDVAISLSEEEKINFKNQILRLRPNEIFLVEPYFELT